ncbi:MAG: amidohydrolase family protein [Promethearchaeota archaeon]
MTFNQIFSKYALIGDNLDLKQDVSIEINEDGTISQLKYKEPEDSLNISNNKETYLLIPGLINSHIHIGDSFAKEMGFNKDLKDIVAPPNGLKHHLLEHTSEDIKAEGINRTAKDMLLNGITCFIDFRERGLDGIELLRKALQKGPIKFKIFGRFEGIKELESIFTQADGIGLASYSKLSAETKKEIRGKKSVYNKYIACHIAELKRRPALMEEIINDNILDIIIHGTHLKSEDLEYISSQHKSLILCPRCNGYFGAGFPPIKKIVQLNIPISLGTDNIMANNPDLFEEIRYLYRIWRVLNEDEKKRLLDSKELLKMITINAAKNFGLQHEIGSLSEGKKADFLVLNLSDHNYYMPALPRALIFPLIVQRTKSENINALYINGNRIYKRESVKI